MLILRIIIAFLFATHSIGAQSDRSKFSLTYSLSRSSKTNLAGGNLDAGLSSSIFSHYEFGERKSRKYSIGLGWLESHFIYRDHSGMQAHRDVEHHYLIKFIVIPAGIKFFIGSFYLHPEVGASHNYGLVIKSHLVDTEMNITNKNHSEYRYSRRFELLLFNAFTVGYEIKTPSFILLTAVKSYVAFNPSSLNTYGVGLMAGLKI